MLMDTNAIRSPPITLPTTWKGAKIINHIIHSAQGLEAHTYPQILEARNPLLHS
jgi:hypothetical protein